MGTDLLRVLERTCELLDGSEETVWSPLSPAEVRRNLEQQIRRIRIGEPVDRTELAVEFAPTSTIQEIAMQNGWHDEYLELAKVIDSATG